MLGIFLVGGEVEDDAGGEVMAAHPGLLLQDSRRRTRHAEVGENGA